MRARLLRPMVAAALAAATVGSAAEAAPLRVQRIGTAPIIRPEMLPGADGANINGPALIRVPAWVARPLGRYYLYFAHHQGRYIRLAYADRLEGPWTVHAPGVLRLEDAPPCVDHVASPDVVADEATRQVRLYFHCPVGRADAPQRTFLALSGDGLRFQASPVALGDAYFRLFRRPHAWYALAWGGRLFRSPDGTHPFEPGPSLLGAPRAALSDTPGPRHVAIQARGDQVWVYYSSIGDEPERILRRRLDTMGEWKSWRTGAAEEVLSPETDYEGTDLPVVRSRWSAATGRERALRDPFVFEEAGRTYLLYSVAGESGIAIAEILGEGKAPTPGAPLPTPVPSPPPDVAGAAYGPHERNVLDLGRARSERPTPLVIFLHGGGFRQGDKRQVPEPLVREALRAGVSVASVNYRLTNVATAPSASPRASPASAPPAARPRTIHASSARTSAEATWATPPCSPSTAFRGSSSTPRGRTSCSKPPRP
jgi:BD-FAE protein